MEPTEKAKVIEKIEQGAFSNLPQLKYTDHKKKGKKIEKAEKAIEPTIQAEGKAHQESDEKADAQVKKAPEPKVPEVAAFPIKSHVNIYGFLGLGKSELRALGLTVVDAKGAKNKLSADVPIELTSYDSTAKVLTVKIG